MEELQPEELEELVQDLEGGSEEEEALPPEVEEMLRDLQPDSDFAVRKRATEQLGRLGTSHQRIVSALIAVKEFDENYLIRRLAAKSLRAPVHREILGQQPDLEELAAAEVSVALLPGRRGEVLRQQPELISWVEDTFAHGVEDLLCNLQSDNPGTREKAAHWLGELNASSFQIVQALLEVGESDSILGVREAALESLGLPVHQEILQDYPDLRQRAQSATEQAATQRQKQRAMQAPEDRKKPMGRYRRSMKMTSGTVEYVHVNKEEYVRYGDDWPEDQYRFRYSVTVVFEADDAKLGTRVIAVKAEVPHRIWKGMERGDTVGILYAPQDPRMVLIQGEW